jgi:hypothetical protein
LCELTNDLSWVNDADALALLAEAEALIEGTPANEDPN